jgi:hypothetical protein
MRPAETPSGPCLNQQADDREPGFLGECRKSGYSGIYFHISSIIEIIGLSMLFASSTSLRVITVAVGFPMPALD